MEGCRSSIINGVLPRMPQKDWNESKHVQIKQVIGAIRRGSPGVLVKQAAGRDHAKAWKGRGSGGIAAA